MQTDKVLLYNEIKKLVYLSESNFEKLFASAILREIKKGENVLKQNEICRNIFFIETGYLRTFVVKDGIEINTDFIFENNFATNLKSLRQAIPSDTIIQAGEKTIVYEFNKDKLLALYKYSPEIESFGRNLLEQLLIQQEEYSNLFKILSPAERYHYLLTNKPEFIKRISLSKISSYLGISRETLSRIRKIK